MSRSVLPRVMFWFSCLMIVFCVGVYVGVKQVFPYSLLLDKAPTSVKAVVQEQKTVAGIRPEHFLNKARYAGKGVTKNLPSETAPGLTLLQGFFDDNNEIRLVKGDG